MTAKYRTDSKFRVEEDALGNVEVPADHLWGAQTQTTPSRP
jgi:fumarate hydratase, class II